MPEDDRNQKTDAFLELFLKVPLPLCLVAADGTVLRMNPRFTTIFGYTLTDMPTLQEWWQLAYPDKSYRDWVIKTWFEAVQTAIKLGVDITPHEYFVRCKDQSVVEMEISGTSLPNGFLATFIDVTKRNQAQRELSQIALIDILTKLPNRRFIENHLQQCIEKFQRHAGYGAYMVIDLDNFKPINDLHGHHTGDLLLIDVAHRLKNAIRASDIVARFGGDEFIVWVDQLGTHLPDAITDSMQIAEKIRSALAIPFCLQLDDKTITHQCFGSIGVAIISAETTSIQHAFERADCAMYEAKKAGKNRVHLLAPSNRSSN